MNAEGNKMGASFAHTRHTEKRRWAPFAISTKAKCERRKSNFQGTIQNLFSSMGLFSIESLSNKGSPPFAYLASMRREYCKIYAGRLKCNEWDSATPCQHRLLHHFTFDIGLFFSPLLSGGDDDDDEKKNASRHTGVKWRWYGFAEGYAGNVSPIPSAIALIVYVTHFSSVYTCCSTLSHVVHECGGRTANMTSNA